jgi:hypothetical protein
VLSERVLEELCRKAPLQEKVVTTAWPSLSVESKLQVIDCIQRTGSSRDTPGWLLGLALLEDAHIVRFWAARTYHFSNREDSVIGEIQIPGVGSEEKARYKRAIEDRSELVRTAATAPGGFLALFSDARTHLDRLHFVRHAARPDYSHLIDFLESGIASGVPALELYEVHEEFFANPAVVEAIKDARHDGYSSYQVDKAIDRAWALVAKAPNPLRLQIAARAPLVLGFKKVPVETLAALPDDILTTVLWRNEQPAKALLELVNSQPDRFSEEVHKSLSYQSEAMGGYDEQEAADRARLESGSLQRETLQAVLKLTQEVSSLKEQLAVLQEQASRKRGLFG